ncbi:MAG TPA: ATP-binding cassette domain-containing protein [Thiolinea sp.]|nr:ATP-binding cassette domain-containing protein [Thiolinea sp.]
MIHTHNIQLKLGGNPILNQVSIQVPKSRFTALIGPNGAGKSTLLHIIARLRKQDAGDIELDGNKIQAYSHNELARHLSVLRQETRIASRLQVRDLVAFGRYPHNKGRRTPKDETIVDQALADFDLEAFAERFLDTLSGGQRQRALLAMNFAQNTDTVLLDEPLNNLDLSYARVLMQLIRTQVEQKARTFVLVLHDLNYAARYADYIIAMKQGEVFAHGETAQIFETGLLSELYDTPIKVAQVDGMPLAISY